MLYRAICRTLSFYLWILIIPLLIPLGIAIYCDYIAPHGSFLQNHSTEAFLVTILFTVVLALFLWLIGRGAARNLYRREALLLVLMIYFLTPLIGGLPFYFSGTLTNLTDAYFEATSGITTTGASILIGKKIDKETGKELPLQKTFITGEEITYTYKGTIDPIIDPISKEILLEGIEAVSYSLLFWRSFMQWLGGGGIIVLFVAILPALGVGGKILYQTEVSGPSKESMMPRIKETASQLWKIYLGLTLIEILLLFWTNKKMPLFDAITLSLSTLSTGGFAPKNAGIGAYDSAFTDCIIMLFMVLGSISFALYFYLMRGKFYKLKDPELKVFLLVIFLSVAFTTWQLVGKEIHVFSLNGHDEPFSFLQRLRYGAFQVISTQTSTGFVTANYDLWPFTIQVLMLILMFIGGMAGSTAGGLKIVREQTFFRIMLNKIESIFRPDTVRLYRVGKSVIDNRTATTVLCFFMVAAFLTIVGTFLLVLDGIDPETSLTSISCMINNVGIGFRAGGPADSFAFLSNFGKILSCILMIAGRLEFFALLVAFVPAFWRRG